ncbi:MAG TPA: SDR family NAD(P)-dependent oxidoreductase [Spongiibacteraceae bacterium]|jgi:short-subunit dehydrogenase|nr:SDR family NAD(P)-dependent oxidoreductase [Spongiibacteraceae bacterium]HUH38064.1 SDR family NAD(P)-dependent oxidoreductase [Spongiibacteraceae bacterium]
MRRALIDSTVWVTGASSGIGRELALQLARRGNRVVATARSVDSLATLVDEGGGNIMALPWDITDATRIEAVTRQLQAMVPRLDVAVLNAGTCEYLDSTAFDPALCRRVFTTNIDGLVNSLAVALPALRKSSVPCIAGVSSLSTYLPLPRAEAYGASKAAVRYFLESLRVDLAREGIAVSVISPGFVKTPLTDRNDFPMPAMISADTAARRIISGIERRKFEVAFPRRLAWTMRAIGWLPARWVFRLSQKIARS